MIQKHKKSAVTGADAQEMESGRQSWAKLFGQFSLGRHLDLIQVNIGKPLVF